MKTVPEGLAQQDIAVVMRHLDDVEKAGKLFRYQHTIIYMPEVLCADRRACRSRISIMPGDFVDKEHDSDAVYHCPLLYNSMADAICLNMLGIKRL